MKLNGWGYKDSKFLFNKKGQAEFTGKRYCMISAQSSDDLSRVVLIIQMNRHALALQLHVWLSDIHTSESFYTGSAFTAQAAAQPFSFPHSQQCNATATQWLAFELLGGHKGHWFRFRFLKLCCS